MADSIVDKVLKEMQDCAIRMKEEWWESTNGKLHLLKSGYYLCIRAVGKYNKKGKSPVSGAEKRRCLNCIRKQFK